MRLLNMETFQLTQFLTETTRPKYAILSHTWLSDKEEKIEGCCNKARESDNLEWVWIDTICIDKRSSAELSEAINSMFKCDHLCNTISNITRIPIAFLRGIPLQHACVAKKMSWASKRKVTRPEDVAYCLLGIFDVNMPLLYGEGDKAFIRLQEQIISQTYDDFVLAWGNINYSSLDPISFHIDYIGEYLESNQPVGVLATSPSSFKDCGNFEGGSSIFGSLRNNPEFRITIVGIRLNDGFEIVRTYGFSDARSSLRTTIYNAAR
ncbi:hypothetical protein F5Y19DRAFT_464215 [Xylariaceae sp. FL1651]|nr:hypothetical protein F5Y19DRAFT_464215 [Xylariaceae sp. FL1651]